MANTNESVADSAVAPAKKGKKSLIFGLLGAAFLGGGGYYATSSGMILGGGGESGHGAEESVLAMQVLPVAFVPLDTMIFSLGSQANARHLKLSAQIEVEPGFETQVAHLKPRFMDVLNTYLRAVDESDLENPSSLTRLRAQMLRRLQVVSGNGWVKDLLITEFVLD